ncbi:MAG TPA: AraC family transcriptional regulator [Polyangiaceae bacterium]|nr:AraC family transcriptional regulator [Polyangiaceae bacterium]
MTKARPSSLVAREPCRDPTALSSWGLVIARTLRDRALDPAALFARAGLSLAALEDPDARIPVQATARVWRLAAEETRDPCFGLDVARHILPTTFQALGFAVLSSRTLREVFERAVRYFGFVSDAAIMRFVDCGAVYRFTVRVTASPPPADESIDAFFAVAVRLCRVLTDRGFAPMAVDLRRPLPPDPGPFARCFRAPVAFSATEDGMTLDKQWCDRPLAGANPEMARASEGIIDKALARMAQASLIDRIRALLTERLPGGEPTQAEIARAFGASTRGLQRRLAAEGVTYAQVVDDTRLELARAYVADARYSLTEVAYLLGFASPGTFTRAFRRWTGQSPSEQRRAGASAG